MISDSQKVIKLPQNRKEMCQFCKKRPATKLCDKVTGEYRFIGHPPKINGKIDWNIPMSGILTCSRLICDECATHISGMDLCPKCAEEIKRALKKKMR